MSRGNKLIKGSMLSVILLIINVAIAFYMMPFLISSLGDKMYGIWCLLGSFIGYYGFLDLGLSLAVSRYIGNAIGKNDHESASKIIHTSFLAFVFIGIVALIVTLVFIVIAPAIIKTSDDVPLFRMLILLVGVNTAVSFPIRACHASLDAHLRFDVQNYIQICSFISRSVLIVLLVKSGFGVLGLAIATVVVSFGQNIAILIYSHQYGFSFKKLTLDIPLLKSMSSFSLYAFGAQISDTLKFHCDSLVITLSLGVQLVTPYQVAITLFQYAGELAARALSVSGPIFNQDVGSNDIEGLKQRFTILTKISLFIASFLSLSMILFANSFFDRWLDKKYDDVYTIVIIFSIAGIFSMGQQVSIKILYAFAKNHYYTILNISEGLANLIISIILVKKMGIVGVALGTAIPSIVIKCIIQPTITCRVLGMPLKEYLAVFYLNVIKLFVFSAVYYFFIVKPFIQPYYWNLVLMSAGHFCFYLIAIFIVFTREERGVILSHFKRKPLTAI